MDARRFSPAACAVVPARFAAAASPGRIVAAAMLAASLCGCQDRLASQCHGPMRLADAALGHSARAAAATKPIPPPLSRRPPRRLPTIRSGGRRTRPAPPVRRPARPPWPTIAGCRPWRRPARRAGKISLAAFRSGSVVGPRQLAGGTGRSLADPQPIAAQAVEYCQDHPARRSSFCLADRAGIVATNAAIVLAREGSADERGRRSRDRRRQPSAAAAVMPRSRRWAACRQTAARSELERLADQQAEFLDSTTPSAYTPDMHVELLLGLIASPAPGEPGQENPRFVAGFGQLRRAEVRRVSLAAWLDPERKDFPPSALELRRDPDPQRACGRAGGVGGAAARSRPRRCCSPRSTTPICRSASRRSGRSENWGRRRPARRWKNCGSHSHEAARVAAVHALSKLVGYQAVVASAHDKSWRVRQAVAESLSQAGREGDPISGETIELAQSLVHDPSLDVQRQMLQSLAAWPLREAGAVLLSAMAEAGYQTRKDAAAQLAARWPAAAEFPVEAPAPERAAAVAALLGAVEERSFRQRRRSPCGGKRQARRRRICRRQSWPGCESSLDALRRYARFAQRCGKRRSITWWPLAPALPTALESPAIADQGALPEALYRRSVAQGEPGLRGARSAWLGRRAVAPRRGDAIVDGTGRKADVAAGARSAGGAGSPRDRSGRVAIACCKPPPAMPGRERCNWPIWRSAIRRRTCVAGRAIIWRLIADRRHTCGAAADVGRSEQHGGDRGGAWSGSDRHAGRSAAAGRFAADSGS